MIEGSKHAAHLLECSVDSLLPGVDLIDELQGGDGESLGGDMDVLLALAVRQEHKRGREIVDEGGCRKRE